MLTVKKMEKRVLIIDDALFMRSFIKQTLETIDFRVVGQASNGVEGIKLAFELQPEYITLDNILPDMIGTDMLKVFKDEGLKSKVILISAVSQESVVGQALKLGAIAYLVKPFTSDKLLNLFTEVYEP